MLLRSSEGSLEVESPSDLLAGLQGVRLLLMEGDYSRARQDLHDLMAVHRGHPMLLMLLATVESHLENPAAAKSAYQALLVSTQDATMLAHAHAGLEDIEQSVHNTALFVSHALQRAVLASRAALENDDTSVLPAMVGAALVQEALGLRAHCRSLLMDLQSYHEKDPCLILALGVMYSLDPGGDCRQVRALLSAPILMIRLFDALAPFYDDLVIQPHACYWTENTADVVDILCAHLPDRGDILDVGCGTGRLGCLLQEKQKSGARTIVGVDISENMLNSARQSGAYARVLHTHAIAMFSQKHFDRLAAVVMVGVAPYVTNVPALIKAAAPFLRPGGILVLDTLSHPQSTAQAGDDSASSDSDPDDYLLGWRLPVSPQDVRAALHDAGLVPLVSADTGDCYDREKAVLLGNSENSRPAAHHLWVWHRPHDGAEDHTNNESEPEDDPNRIIITPHVV